MRSDTHTHTNKHPHTAHQSYSSKLHTQHTPTLLYITGLSGWVDDLLFLARHNCQSETTRNADKTGLGPYRPHKADILYVYSKADNESRAWILNQTIDNFKRKGSQDNTQKYNTHTDTHIHM